MVTATFISPQGWTTKSVAGGNSATSFTYNPIGELLSSTDADGYTTLHEYNMFGWRTKRIHPDAGETRWVYDPAGHVVEEQTKRHINASQHIAYDYCFDKLIQINYPLIPTNSVLYKYDVAGRVAYWEDGTGSTRLYYDQLGNIKTTLRHIVIPTETNAYNFKTETNYDSFGRIKSILYPDGEDVQYQYHLGGRLKSVKGYRGTTLLHNIVDSLYYDAQGRKKRIRYGNGVTTDYSYSLQRDWLTRLRTVCDSGTLQNIVYYYDHVGNISELRQYALPVTSMGGSYRNNYYYNQQYRLIRANAVSTYPYTFTMDYSPAGRIGHRHYTNTSGIAENQSIYGYDKYYHTHQPRVVYDSIGSRKQQFFWDANGNMDQIYDCKYETTRFHQWDDVNRLRMVLGPSKGGFYGYDANGERVYKLFGDYNVVSTGSLKIGASFNIDDAVVYPNSFLTITPRGYTKHYFAGSERVATALGDGQWIEDVPISAIETTHDYNIIKKTFEPLFSSFPLGYPNYEDIDINLDINGINQSPIQYCTNPYALKVLSLNFSYGLLYQTMSYYTEHQGGSEKIFYYHGDHLGSASWITDSHCAPIQYLHYLPYGEIIANQNPSSIYNERFKFTGKELDEESGYYYFGARYYWSTLGIFTQSDPLAGKYPWITSYAYCANNPVKFVDPDGSWFETAWDLFNLGLDIHSLKANVQNGNVGEAMLDAAGLILDAGAVALPVVTAGVGVALKLYRTTDKVVDAGTTTSKFRQAIMRGVQSEQRVLKEMRLSKNTKKMVSRTNSGKPVNVIPDAVQDGVMYEVKDTKAVYNTKQIQGEYNAAKEAGYEFKIVTGEKTHISKEVQSRAEIIRRSDLGPQ